MYLAAKPSTSNKCSYWRLGLYPVLPLVIACGRTVAVCCRSPAALQHSFRFFGGDRICKNVFQMLCKYNAHSVAGNFFVVILVET
jgi:hypothetical protein